MTVSVRSLTNQTERRAAIPALSALRIEVFRDWPYLYDGSAEYEAEYLAEFIGEASSVLVIAEDDGAIIGAATASPMTGQKREFQAPLINGGIDVERLFYFGESVLLSGYRGHGIGHKFFDAREQAARAAGANATAFCAVVRPDNHPLKPQEPRDLHPFWRARGYQPIDGLTGILGWKELDQPGESEHQMQFWMRSL
jgi:GNAT superfamily N-acetyltransferase